MTRLEAAMRSSRNSPDSSQRRVASGRQSVPPAGFEVQPLHHPMAGVLTPGAATLRVFSGFLLCATLSLFLWRNPCGRP